MPTSNNTSSPVKRPGLGRRSASSHALISTRTSPSNQAELSHSHTQKTPVHNPHRPHVVGGAHRLHGRNPSFGKNLNKLQKLMGAEGATTSAGARHHQRKKSAPVTPAASPRGHHHVRWDSAKGALGDHKANVSMKKNYSSPALRRNTSGVLGKKALVTDRPHAAKGQVKKVVGFQLADSDDDDGEWEDSTQSPESTRRNSEVPVQDGAEDNTVLVDPLTFVKRPYPQAPQASSLPEQNRKSLSQESHQEDQHTDEDDDDDEEEQSSTEEREQRTRTVEHEDIASRLLSQSRSSKAPPAMSSVSAMAKPAAVDPTPRTTSLSNIASSQDASRRSPLSTSNPANTPGNNTQGTSSSMEGGVSRFIINDKSGQSRTDSDPNTPSSFLPHYHPQTPPSPGQGATSKRTKTSPPPRPPGGEPPSRTQQKLWLQRTAALSTSPPDSHGPGSTMSPSTMDPAFTAHSRPGSRPYDGGRGMNGSARAGGTAHDGEAKHIRKAYEKTASELNVVRRFQNPTKDSFSRVSRFMNEMERPATGAAQNQSPTKTEKKRHGDSETGLTQLISKARPFGLKSSGSRVNFQDQDDAVNVGDTAEPVDRLGVDNPSHSQNPTHPVVDDAAHGGANDSVFPDETVMMLRRMWESREVPTAG